MGRTHEISNVRTAWEASRTTFLSGPPEKTYKINQFSESQKESGYITHLINLGSNQLLVTAIIVDRHEIFYDIHQAPEGVLFVHKQQGNSDDTVEPLTILNVRIVHAIS